MMLNHTICFEAPLTFSVPCDVVDKHLSAPETELKLLLLLLRNANTAFLKDQLLRILDVDEKRLEEAFHYWVKRDVIFYAAGKYSLQRPKLSTSDFVSYNPDTVAKRLEEDPAIQFLYQSAEDSLKKPLSSTDAALILSLVDWCGLPADVVALLIRYGSENGKSLRQISQTGVRWADDGVKTFEQAEEVIRRETEQKQTVNRTAARFGILGTRAVSEAERKIFLKWNDEYGYGLDMVGAAYEEAIKSTGKYSYQYIDRILTKWHEAGYTTPDQGTADRKPASATPRKSTRRAPAANNPRRSATPSDAMDLAWVIAGGEEDSEP